MVGRRAGVPRYDGLELFNLLLLLGNRLLEISELETVEEVPGKGVKVEWSWTDLRCVLDGLFIALPDIVLRQVCKVVELVVGFDEVLESVLHLEKLDKFHRIS